MVYCFVRVLRAPPCVSSSSRLCRAVPGSASTPRMRRVLRDKADKHALAASPDPIRRSRRTRLRFGLLAFLFVTCGAAFGAGEEVPDPLLRDLLTEASRSNPDIQVAQRDLDAARSRVSPVGALDDPMLELGVVNLPAQSRSFRTEDMTMKMIGLTQRMPYPGKRALRKAIAEREADAAEQNLQELANKVRRDVKVAYFDLALVEESERVTQNNLRLMEQLSSIAESRYAVGQATQSDVLKAQTQRARMQEELIKLGRERPMFESELNRALGRGAPVSVQPGALQLLELELPVEDLRAAARASRPQLIAQQRTIDRTAAMLDMARKEYYPDVDFRLSYGQRDPTPDGMKREDMISFVVAINLPVWRGRKLEPRVSEAESMREEARSMYQAKLNETDAMLRQQVAAAEQSLRSARLYESALLPQARLSADASLTAYRVGRVDFMTLLDSQVTVFNAELGHAAALASRNKALADIELLTGRELF